MTARRTVVLLVIALAAYFAIIGYRGVYLVQQHALGLRVLGVAVLVLPLVGIWVVVAEIRFGLGTQRLAERLDAEGAPPEEEPARLPSGRIDRSSADELFARRRWEVEADPGDWRGWYRLAIAYDQAGDRRRARAAMRAAIEKAAER
jgi:cytochrome c-type biogenesis protein CcmH/NrfG